MQPPKPTDTHVVVRATGKDPQKKRSTGEQLRPKGALLWDGPIQKGRPLVNYVPAQAFRDADAGYCEITWGTEPEETP